MFTVTSFWFKLLGASPAELTVNSSKGGSVVLTEAVYGKNNDGNFYNLLGNALFTDVEWVTFTNSGKGNVRVDDIGTPAAVPLPAAGWLMIAGLGGLAALRRKRKAI
ncbi:MAG: sorting protein [Cypionkella sp.]|uniref:VPLPA-CTERM sorting domain-containing protein n=1 Tax=Cypionkella sp. TaxID=2811411 RepID=UPI00261FD9A2|nr:VPLPA-CTERM sorting domain-containing protein [Cypionkella sp.]MDB5661592.1 sorting protein [Cypionkella sp.]